MNSERSLDQKQQDLMKGYRIGQLNPGFKCKLVGTCLGKGGQSIKGVYEGIDIVTKNRYAIKRFDLDDDVACDATAEFNTIKHLRHENLVRYYGIDIELSTDPRCADELWLVMELCQASSLRELAKKGLQPRKVIEIAEQILSGLECLHDARIVHRDLKGHNVLIGFDDKIKLADFGLSKQLRDSTTVTGEIETDAGTWRYMAPEAMNSGVARIGRRSDMWSFGCVLIDMITKQEPRYNVDKDGRERVTNRNQAIFFIGRGNPPTFEKTAFSGAYSQMQIKLLTTMMDKCLQTYPDERPTASELLQYMKKPSSITVVASSSESSITVRTSKPAVQQSSQRANHTGTIRLLNSWSLEDKSIQEKENITTTTVDTAASTSARVHRMLANATSTDLPGVGRYRSLPFKFPHYVMVDVNDYLSPLRFIMQYMDDFLANPSQTNNLSPIGILLERVDSELHQYEKNAKMGLEMGTLGSLKRQEYHTLIVWPNCAAGGLDKLTTKRQLEDAFSIRASRLVIVIQSKIQPEIMTRSKWRFLIQDAQDKKRLLQM